MTMMTVDGLDDYNDLFALIGVWFGLGFMALGPLGLGFRFSFFSLSSFEVLGDLLGYGSHTVFVVTWQTSTRSYTNAILCSTMNN